MYHLFLFIKPYSHIGLGTKSEYDLILTVLLYVTILFQIREHSEVLGMYLYI